MKEDITASDFTAAFHRMGRGDQFSHGALLAIYDFLTEIEADTGEELELDVIAVCCDFSEYESAAVCAAEYEGHVPDPDIEDEDETNEAALEWLRDRTTVLELDGGGVVIQQF